jgi:hypothetical protein
MVKWTDFPVKPDFLTGGITTFLTTRTTTTAA